MEFCSAVSLRYLGPTTRRRRSSCTTVFSSWKNAGNRCSGCLFGAAVETLLGLLSSSAYLLSDFCVRLRQTVRTDSLPKDLINESQHCFVLIAVLLPRHLRPVAPPFRSWKPNSCVTESEMYLLLLIFWGVFLTALYYVLVIAAALSETRPCQI